jgi:ribosomal protein L37AE/L43A
MAAKAGENAWETGDFRCTKCHQKTHVTKGHKIPKCPHCGNDTYDTRVHEPGNRSS